MAENIFINDDRVREDAGRLEGAAAYLKSTPLSPQDQRTTLPANSAGLLSYEEAQKNLACLGTVLDRETENIRELHMAFEEFDEMLGRLSRGGGADDKR